MADKIEKTTSSNSLDENEPHKREEEASVVAPPKQTETQIMTKLASSLTESYQLVKQRQQKYNELSCKLNDSSTARQPLAQFEWQEVCKNKNKLKRKKNLSASLTSVSDTVNQEKRTRIEGIQLNCRGKLLPLGAVIGTSERSFPLATKPPLPPIHPQTASTPVKVPPPRLKRKLQENMQTIQKLSALTEQLRLEINGLKSNLTTERGAVRVLRAQNESESRRWKNEVKKLQQAVELLKKSTSTGAGRRQEAGSSETFAVASSSASTSSLVNHEIQRLTNELLSLKEANKASEERKLINCDADRRKAADIRELRDSYEIRLTQLTKSAKNEISRLLEEIKTKERNIGQLKKELQQQPCRLQGMTTNSRNATKTKTKTTMKTSNKTTNKTKKSQQQKPQEEQQQAKQQEHKSDDVLKTNKTADKTKTEEDRNEQEKNKQKDEEKNKQKDENKDASRVQNPDEMKQLKDFELINNTRILSQNNINNNTNINSNSNINSNNNNSNNEKNLVHRTTKIFNIAHNTKLKIQEEPQHTDAPEQHQHQQQYNNKSNNSNDDNNNDENNMLTETQTNFKSLFNNTNNINNKRTQNTATTTSITNDDPKEQQTHHSLPHELLSQRFVGTHDDLHEYRGTKDNNSDSDSALSSAPPSISPQPPPNGMEATDIWQSLRNYSSDMEKLQKDLHLLQKENTELRQELHVAKEQIMESEKSVLAADNHNSKLQQLVERIRYLEEQEHQLQAESNELREQNELLEFRILELEDNNDKWSMQNHAPTPSCTSSTTSSMATTKDVWSCGQAHKDDQMGLLFGGRSNSHVSNLNSGLDPPPLTLASSMTSPLSQKNLDEHLNAMSSCNLNLVDNLTNDELRRLLVNMPQRLPLNEDELQCVQQMLSLLQNLDAISHRSGPNSLNTSSSDEPSSFDLVKSRISDYSSASSTGSSSSDLHLKSKSSVPSVSTAATGLVNSRIVATVLPYNSTAAYQHHVPANTPTDSPRKARNAWHSNSLSESGVFVESDFLSDASEKNVCTQTDFEEAAQVLVTATAPTKELTNEIQNQKYQTATAECLSSSPRTLSATVPCDPKRLQYYKERLELLESKVLIYESSGDLQVRRLADRLQREIELEKHVKDLRDRVDFLEEENATLEEEKCEFEEAENDTRLRLQRLEVEQEILTQRNIELEMSREALSAKYKDCRSECLILRDDLSVSETQIRHLEEDKQKAKENFEFLHSTLPLFILYGAFVATSEQPQPQQHHNIQQQLTVTENTPKQTMGNVLFPLPNPPGGPIGGEPQLRTNKSETSRDCERDCACACSLPEIDCLKEEVKILRHQIKDLNSQHYEAMESADSLWVDLEKDYKDREQSFLGKEACLKQKINRLQDCLRDDARAANEKITQLEEAEKELKACLLRMSKELRDLSQEHKNLLLESQHNKEQLEKMNDLLQPLKDALALEKKRNKTQCDELSFMHKLQTETESRNLQEMETLRHQLDEVKKEFLHVEVTNSELKEEVTTLEHQIEALQNSETEYVDKIRVLMDEVRSKEEMCVKLEKQLQRSEGYSLAQELDGSPSKRAKRETIYDLQSASKGLGSALRGMKDCGLKNPSHQKFTSVARDVKKLADSILGNAPIAEDDEVSPSLKSKSEAVVDEEPLRVQIPVPESVPESVPDPVAEPVTEPAAEPVDDESNRASLTVGMALVSEFNIDVGLLPSCSSLIGKKQIFEVPSEMRKLKDYSQIQENFNGTEKKRVKGQPKEETMLVGVNGEKGSLYKRSKRPKRLSKYCARIRLWNRTAPMFRARIGEPCANEYPVESFHDTSDITITQSEVLQHNVSFHSIQSVDDFETFNSKIDAWTEMEFLQHDKSIGTQVTSAESSVQVNDDIYVENLLSVVPLVIREFLKSLQSSVIGTNLHTCHYNEALRKRWDVDEEFRVGLDILQHFSTFDIMQSTEESMSMESYENFVNAMSCLHVLEELYKPIKIPLLQQIEDQVNEQLMNFHSQKMESEFYCTVYYPVTRQVPLNANDLMIK